MSLAEPTGAFAERAEGSGKTWRQICVAIGFVTFFWSPLLLRHGMKLIAREHYQFVILIPVFAIFLARKYTRDRRLDEFPCGSARATLVLGICATLVVGVATFLQSTWLGTFGYLVSLLTIGFAVGGPNLVRVLFAAWLLLGFILPLPFDLDVVLIQDLRQAVTAWSSSLLNLIGVLHLVEGNSIEIPQKSFFVADACTGIHSLFVLAAVAVFCGLWLQRTAIHILGLVAGSIGLAVLENILRISGVIVAYRSGIDVSEGWKHDLLGFILFAVTCLLLLSADQLLFFVLPSTAFLSKLLGWKPAVRTVSDAQAVLCKTKFPKGIFVALGIPVVIIGAWQIRQFPVDLAQVSTPSAGGQLRLQSLGEEALPVVVEGFQRRNFQAISRTSNFGMLSANSQVWTFTQDDLQLQISLDYPYEAIHPLTLCYELIGWTTVRNELVTPSVLGNSREPIAPFVYTELSKPVDGSGHLFFSYINFSGEEGVRLYPIRQEPNARDLVSKRLKAMLGKIEVDVQQTEIDTKSNAGLRGPMCQFQLLVQLPGNLSDQQRQRLERFFIAARGLLKANLLKN